MFMDPRVTLEACNIQVTDTVADFGAGSGFVARAAALIAAQGNVFAVELRRDLVTRIAREVEEQNIKNLHALWGDVEIDNGSTLKSDSIDFVILSNILFQLDDKVGALREAARVLKTGGRMLVADWQESFGGLGPTPDRVITKEICEALAAKVGFTKLSENIPAGEHHYAIIFKK